MASSATAPAPGVFLSYSTEDSPAARKLAADLKEHGVRVWDPQSVLQPGEPWATQLMSAVAESKAVLVLVSRHTESSSWQSTEIALALSEAAKVAGKQVIPIVLDRSQPLPFLLRNRQALDLSDESHYQANFERLLGALTIYRPAVGEWDDPGYADLIESSKATLRAEKVIEARRSRLSMTALATQLLGVSVSGLFAVAVTVLVDWSVNKNGSFPLYVGLIAVLATSIGLAVSAYSRKHLMSSDKTGTESRLP